MPISKRERFILDTVFPMIFALYLIAGGYVNIIETVNPYGALGRIVYGWLAATMGLTILVLRIVFWFT